MEPGFRPSEMSDETNHKRTVNLFHKLQNNKNRHGSHGEPAFVHPSIEQRNREQQRMQFAFLKYMIFASNVIYWFVGMCILVAGACAYSFQDTLSNLSLITRTSLNPLTILLVASLIAVVVGVTACMGSIGAWNENLVMLSGYSTVAAIFILLEMIFATLGFLFQHQIVEDAATQFRTFLTNYPSVGKERRVLDWVQESWLRCCGLRGPADWDANRNFNCSAETIESCGVPNSCCKPQPDQTMTFVYCAYNVRSPDYQGNYKHVIYDKGCRVAAEEWAKKYLVPIIIVAVILAILQMLGIFSVQKLREDLTGRGNQFGLRRPLTRPINV